MNKKQWNRLTQLYKADHLSKKLKSPQTRLSALARVEDVLLRRWPQIIEDPSKLRTIEKNRFLDRLESFKGSDLNSAEKSVVTGLYNFLPQLASSEGIIDQVLEPISTPKEPSRTKNAKTSPNPKTGDKEAFYSELASALSDALSVPLKFEVSHYFDVLRGTPKKHQFPKTWDYLKNAYAKINGFGFDLDERIEEFADSLKMKSQETDVLITSPFTMMVEYDEEQHFNPFRGMTLECGLYVDWNGFPMHLYKDLCDVPEKTGSMKSGFYTLQSADPLFPEREGEERQNNRLRQRAFRDLVKDAWSVEMGWPPVLRIPAFIVDWKRKGLNSSDCTLIKDYIKKLNK